MVSRAFALLLCLSAVARKRDVIMKVTSLERDTVVIRVTNNTGSDIVFLSPETPKRQIDRETCRVTVSTVINRETYSFAFTPTLRTVGTSRSHTFRATLSPLVLPRDCHEWTVVARLAYLSGEDLRMFHAKSSFGFREYVLTHQRAASAEAKMTAASPAASRACQEFSRLSTITTPAGALLNARSERRKVHR